MTTLEFLISLLPGLVPAVSGIAVLVYWGYDARRISRKLRDDPLLK